MFLSSHHLSIQQLLTFLMVSAIAMGVSTQNASAHIKADNLPPSAATSSANGGKNKYPSYSPTQPKNRSAQEPNSTPFTVNPSQVDINLLDIETRRQVFSPVLLSPTRRFMAFSEVLYYPHQARVLSSLFTQPIATRSSAPNSAILPEDFYRQQVLQAIQERQEFRAKWAKRIKKLWPFGEKPSPQVTPIQPMYDPAAPNSLRRQVYAVGTIGKPQPTPLKYADYYNNTPHLETDIEGHLIAPKKKYRRDFQTLTPVDFSADGNQLLFKHKSGKLYEGLLITQLLVYNVLQPDVSAIDIYPQLHQAVDYYWTNQGITPPLTEQDWDVVPLGWRPGSNTDIETKAWAYTHQNRIFLGHWRINTVTGRPKLIDVMDRPVPVASNGAWVNIPNQTPSRF